MDNDKLVDLLIEKKYHITCSESCTGGLLASRIVDVANASKVFDVSFVTYANSAKVELLGVSEETISKYGVVSEEVTREMVIGLHNRTKAECAMATSGIAGPTGGSDKKPVGMVCFGFLVNDIIDTKTIIFPNTGRNSIREKAVDYAIKHMIELLEA